MTGQDMTHTFNYDAPWHRAPRFAYFVLDAKGQTVAQCYDENLAALVSAAPDLLTALQNILAITDRDQVAWHAAHAAIKKATG